ncbi:MAG: ABC transporter substrate-binding protein [Actinomycetota bacterium]|nr:ABC transporter substrate-binding protein [Actinomycetota bacterium]
MRIGLLRSSPLPDRSLDALRRGLTAKGYIEGQGFVLVSRFGDGNPGRLPNLATALVTAGVDVIVTEGVLATQAARTATATIPIVMATSPDPQQAGLIESLSHPGGNITGLTSQATDMSGKLLELAKEMMPGLARVALIMPRSTWDLFRAETMAAARTLGLQVLPVDLDLSDIDAGLRQAVAERAQAGIVRARPLFSIAQVKSTVESAAAHRLPVIYESRDFVEFGGLMAFGVDVPDHYHRVAWYVDQILRGAKPADLPVEQPTKFELVINLKTAKALGIELPPTLLARANEVIE